MNRTRDFDRAVDRWLDDGSDVTPPEVIDAVLLAVRSAPQERDFRVSWRTSPMTFLRVAAVFVAIAVAGLAALYALGVGPNVGSGPSPSAALPSVEPSSPGDGSLPVGPHVMVSMDGLDEDRVTVTIPHSGWFAEPDQASLTKDRGGNNRVMVMTVPGDHYQVPENMCSWKGSRDLVPPDEPVGGLRAHDVTFLLGQQTYDTPEGPHRRDLSQEVDISIDGASGRSVTGPVPDIDPSGCDEQRFCSLLDSDGNRCLLPHLDPGEIVTYWAVDHERLNLWVVAASYWPTTDNQFLSEMNEIVDSMTIIGE